MAKEEDILAYISEVAREIRSGEQPVDTSLHARIEEHETEHDYSVMDYEHVVEAYENEPDVMLFSAACKASSSRSSQLRLAQNE